MNQHPEHGLLVSIPGRMQKASMRALLLALALSYATAGIGAALTELGPWYFALKHPPWKPPDAAFGVIWSTIFTLCAISGWLTWQAADTPALRRRVLVLFGVNAVLNIAWSALYFKLQRPDWALFEVVFLWLSILALIMGLWRLSFWYQKYCITPKIQNTRPCCFMKLLRPCFKQALLPVLRASCAAWATRRAQSMA